MFNRKQAGMMGAVNLSVAIITGMGVNDYADTKASSAASVLGQTDKRYTPQLNCRGFFVYKRQVMFFNWRLY